MNKSGLTMVQIVLYVVIFFALVALATGTSMAMNANALKDKGEIYVNEAEIKIKSNFLNSMNNSDTFYMIGNKIVFSNNDVYNYDNEKFILYKNNGILIQNLTEFNFNVTDHTDKIKNVSVTGKILKYSKENNFNFLMFKGDSI